LEKRSRIEKGTELMRKAGFDIRTEEVELVNKYEEFGGRSGMNTPFFSVIVPVYNVENYLKQCIESIICQTYTDYELILVDDCSTDNSGKLCDVYTTATIIHKNQNEGLAEARNSGLEICTGEYVIFIDSDDYLLDKYAFEKICRKINETKSDALIFGYVKYFESTGKYESTVIGSLSDESKTSVTELIKTNAYKALAWNKVVSLQLIKNAAMHFPNVRTSEDTIWCYELLKHSECFTLLKEEVYAYRQRNGSIIRPNDVKKTITHIDNVIYSIKFCCDDIRETDLEKNALYSYLAYEYSWLLGTVYPFLDRYKADMKKLTFLLRYDICDKVKKVKILYKLVGLKLFSFICYKFIILRMKWVK
jgi:glycosyltransferase involved in cell wall biosynthesis